MTKTELKNKLDQLEVKYCFNEQIYSNDNLKFIIVGDNPGKTEYLENKFFIGPSGQVLRKHFLTNMLTKNFDEECIIFNKTFIHTAKTKDLEPILTQIGKALFTEIQEYCANEISELANEFNLPIFGKSNIGPDLLFNSFWKSINSTINDKGNILVFNHPSPPYLQFEKEWDKYRNQGLHTSNLDLLQIIGKNNAKKIQEKYKQIKK